MNIYKTADIYLASFIVARGYTIQSTEKLTDKNRTKTFFVLVIPKEELDELKTQFYSGQGLNVNVSRYTMSLKNLKSICFME